MNKEIEKKFLARVPRDLIYDEEKKIIQGYILITKSLELRVRDKAGEYFFTAKVGAGFVRGEFERRIPWWLFKILFDFVTHGWAVQKVRKVYRDELSGLKWEIDFLDGEEDNIVEVELPSEEYACQIPDLLAPYIIADVTEDNRYKMQNVARYGMPRKYQV